MNTKPKNCKKYFVRITDQEVLLELRAKQQRDKIQLNAHHFYIFFSKDTIWNNLNKSSILKFRVDY